MNKPKISPDFTIEDIHRIREANEERRQAMTKEAYRAEVRADALFIQEKILKMRKASLSKWKVEWKAALPNTPLPCLIVQGAHLCASGGLLRKSGGETGPFRRGYLYRRSASTN